MKGAALGDFGVRFKEIISGLKRRTDVCDKSEKVDYHDDGSSVFISLGDDCKMLSAHARVCWGRSPAKFKKDSVPIM